MVKKEPQNKTKTCPYCKEKILFEALKCKHCGEILDADLKRVSSHQRTWSPGMATILSLFFPGAGQVYKGKLGEGFIWFVVVIIGYVMMFIPGLLLHIVCISRAYSSEPAQVGGGQKSGNKKAVTGKNIIKWIIIAAIFLTSLIAIKAISGVR